MGKKKRKQKRQEELYTDPYLDMDDTFSYIAGYTSGGAPYGVTWEEVGIDSGLPFDEKIRLYMKQFDEAAVTISVDTMESRLRWDMHLRSGRYGSRDSGDISRTDEEVNMERIRF